MCTLLKITMNKGGGRNPYVTVRDLFGNRTTCRAYRFKPMEMPMQRYQAESVHQIGYGWHIIAPNDLSIEDVEAFQQAIIDYTDNLDKDTLPSFWQTYSTEETFADTGLDVEKMYLFRLCSITFKSVHRESYGQSLRRSV